MDSTESQPQPIIEPTREFRQQLRRGRKPGQRNKHSASMKWNLLEAWRLTGSVDAFAKWGKKNPSIFYPLVVRALMPRMRMEEPGDSNVLIQIRNIFTDSLQQKPLELSPIHSSSAAPTD